MTPPATPTGKRDVGLKLPDLRRGSKGQHVQKLQALLNVMDLSKKPRLAEDGVFGKTTEDFVRDWQKFFNLKDEPGVCSAQTWQSLIELPL